MFERLKAAASAFFKSSRSYPVILDGLYGNDPSVERDFLWNAQQYERMPWLYAAIFQISTSIARLPWQIIKKTRLTEAEMKEQEGDSKFKVEDITDDTDNPLVALLMQPNAEMTWFDFMESVCSLIELSGNAYVELSKDSLDQIGDMYVMRPDRVKVLAGEGNKLVKGYEFKVNSASNGTFFDARDVMHIKTFNPTDDWYGLASVKPATLSLNLEDAARKFNVEFFLNDATPGGVLSTEANITKEDAERIEERWRQRNAAGKRRRTVILPFGIKYDQVGTDIKDIEFENLMKQTTQEQLAVTGVPPAKVGLLQFAKYSNYEIQNRAFYEDTIEPKIMKIQSSINLSIVSRFNDEEAGVTYHFKFDLRKKIGENDDTVARRFERYFRMGCVTPNEVRLALGLGETYDEGDEYYIDKGLIPINEASISFMGETGEEVGETGTPDTEDTEDQAHQSEEDVTRSMDDLLEETLEAIGVDPKEIVKLVEVA